MRDETKTFEGPFAKYIEDYLKEKESIGNKVENFIYPLKSFDTFSNEYDCNLKYLTKEVVLQWLETRENEKQSNLIYRASHIRSFGKYMNIRDKKSYILPNKFFSRGPKYNAYIYSEKQIYRFFFIVDQYVKIHNNSKKYCSLQIIFRLLYMCGMRISETLNIKLKDFDEAQKIITICKGKKNKDRIIAINDELTDLIIKYKAQFHIFSDNNTYLFEKENKKPYTRYSIYYEFRKFLERSGIEHSGDGPNLHSFRHTYAVHRLKRWVLEGKDLMVYLPILKTYLGHDSFKETAYYLKLTADVFPNITKKVELQYNNLIPRLEG